MSADPVEGAALTLLPIRGSPIQLFTRHDPLEGHQAGCVCPSLQLEYAAEGIMHRIKTRKLCGIYREFV